MNATYSNLVDVEMKDLDSSLLESPKKPPRSVSSPVVQPVSSIPKPKRKMPDLQVQSPTSILSPSMSPQEVRDKMDKFIMEHRKYIRNFSDMYKKDMDVLAQLTLNLSSQKDTRSAFEDYLKHVDELAERKIQYANTLRQYISSLK